MTKTRNAIGRIGGDVVDVEGAINHASPAVVVETSATYRTTTDVGGS